MSAAPLTAPTPATAAAPVQAARASVIPDRTVALYDGDCGFCQFQMRIIKKLDWLGKIECVPLQSDRAAELTPGLAREEMLAAMHAIPGGHAFDPEHKIRGARAVRCLALRLPLLFPLGLIMWIPLVIYPAEWCYKKIASNRYFISKVIGCDSGACEIPRKPKK